MIEQTPTTTPKGEVASPRAPALATIDASDLRRFLSMGRWLVEYLDEKGTDLIWHGESFTRHEVEQLVERYDAEVSK